MSGAYDVAGGTLFILKIRLTVKRACVGWSRVGLQEPIDFRDVGLQ